MTRRAEDYRGPGPFSEPETRNIQHYISRNQITACLSNHTFTGLWLRPPGVASFGESIDEKLFKRLGAKATSENGYANIPSYQLYDTTGGDRGLGLRIGRSDGLHAGDRRPLLPPALRRA